MLMANLKINTDAAVTAANNIKLYNRQMRDSFTQVQNSVRQLDSAWDGEAASNAIKKFNELNSKFSDARYNVLDNYANYLLRQVGEGYTQTENVNKSLAAQFK